jgi:hypothetical protein
MNKIFIGSVIAAAFAMLTFSGQMAQADTAIISTTTTTSPGWSMVMGPTSGPGPQLLVTDPAGAQVMVPSVLNVNPPGFVTTGATITAFNTYWPNDLLTRRDDLIARIYVEQANGKLSASQVSSLVAEVNGVLKTPIIGDECLTSQARHVKFMYRDFDRASNDIFRESHMGNKQLAGKYNVIVL